jgi:Ras-related protein Rab-28
VWDIGGQSLSNNKLLSTYISGASVVFLVYDVTDAQSFKDVSDWLQLMRRAFTTTVTPTSASAAHSPSVYLCGNKIDLEHLRKVSQLEHERFVADNALQGGFFVSARSGEHVLTSFYQAAAAQLGFTLTPEELEQTQKVLAVTVQGRADNEARTVDAEQIEREDAAAELAKQKGGCCVIC